MKINKLYVKYNQQMVGTLAMTSKKKVAFQYDDQWLKNGFSISPFSLPLIKNVFVPSCNIFNGLFGVFADSLPDSWGELLVDRYLTSKNIKLEDITVLDRLAYIANNGMGALYYEPAIKINDSYDKLSLDQINEDCGKILHCQPTTNLDTLFKMGGSSGGARPKVMIELEKTSWIIKFSNHIDSKDAGKIEYEYSECARACGIDMPKTKLFPSNVTSGYFGIERFDRSKDKRIHTISVAGLLELDYRAPSLYYKDLIKLTKILTNNKDTYEIFRRMCFNIVSCNLDDHSKNFSFLYDDINKCWRLSPAYDITHSQTFYGEHTTSVNGKGKNITDEDLIQVGLDNRLDKIKCEQILAHVKKCVTTMLNKYIK